MMKTVINLSIFICLYGNHDPVNCDEGLRSVKRTDYPQTGDLRSISYRQGYRIMLLAATSCVLRRAIVGSDQVYDGGEAATKGPLHRRGKR